MVQNTDIRYTDSLDTDNIEIGYRYSIQYMVLTLEDKHKTYQISIIEYGVKLRVWLKQIFIIINYQQKNFGKILEKRFINNQT